MKKFFTPRTIILLVFLFIVSIIFTVSTKFFDMRVNDFLTKAIIKTTNQPIDSDVVLVVIDDKSIKAKEWPWTKDVFSDIFDYFEFHTKAKSVVFQNLILFSDSYNPDKDAYFYNSLLKYKKLINSFVLLTSSKASDVLHSDFIAKLKEKSNVRIEDKRTVKVESNYKAVVKLPREFLSNSKYLASSILTEDDDNLVRYYTPVVELNNVLYPSLALSAYAMNTGIDSFTLYDDYLCSSDNCKTLKMPVNFSTKSDYLDNSVNGIFTFIYWYKATSSYYSHKTYSAIDIIDSYKNIKVGKEPIVNPNEFEGKTIIIGLNADDYVWGQLSETPILKKQADIDIHAVILDNMFANTFKKMEKNNYIIFITFLFSFFIIRGFKKFRYNLFFTSILSILYLGYYVHQFFARTYIPPITPIIIMFSAAILKKLYEIIITDNKSEMIKNAMGKYISKDVMNKVISNLDNIQVGGKRTVVSILFVDIRNFTSISEKLSPQDVTSVLNEYFATIEPIIEKYQGFINKYMGDGVLALFGEPVNTNNHAYNATKCAMDIINEVKFLREKFIREGKPKIEIGIGINTGEVFIGNIGTRERLEYTVIGDNVNLAYRIESFNQVLKTQFLISQYTYEYIKDKVDVVKLSEVSIKGKTKPIDIYEILKVRNE